MSRQQVSTDRVIAADRQKLFDLVADPANHPLIDGSGTVLATRGDVPDRLGPDVHFGMSMQRGARYPILNTVVEFEEGRLLAWRHLHGHRWRYRFEDVEGGTRVTETFDWSLARSKLTLVLLGFPRRNLRGMRRTLERLDELAITGTVPDDPAM